MLSIILIAIGVTLATSFLCSLTEAALYSVPLAYVRHLAETGSRSGRVLLALKTEVNRPISAILILNTVANTLGPAFCGALVAAEYGETGIIVLSALLTLLILFFGEITPKILGVMNAKKVALFMAFPVSYAVTVASPLIWISNFISKSLQPKSPVPSVSYEELLSMARIGLAEGSLDHFEGSVIKNVIGLDKVLVRDVLTPRVVVFRVSEDRSLADIEQEMVGWNYTRVPIYSPDDPDHLSGYVRQRDIFREFVRGNRSKLLREIARPITTVPEVARADKVLLGMFEAGEHICAVVDEHGGLAGIITQEDILEEVVGREIVDEYDTGKDISVLAGMLKTSEVDGD